MYIRQQWLSILLHCYCSTHWLHTGGSDTLLLPLLHCCTVTSSTYLRLALSGGLDDRLTLFLACSLALRLSTSALHSASSRAIHSTSSHALHSASSLRTLAHLQCLLYFAALMPSSSLMSSVSCTLDQVLMLPRGADMMIVWS